MARAPVSLPLLPVLCWMQYVACSDATSKYTAFYFNDLNATASFTNLVMPSGWDFQGSIADAKAAKAKGIPSLLQVPWSVWNTSKGAHFGLRTDWEARWAEAADLVEPLVKDGTILGFNLGDELVWNCVALENVSALTTAVKGRFPSSIIWYNEAWPPIGKGIDSCGNNVSFSIPSMLDWFSIDLYRSSQADWTATTEWVNKNVKTFYAQYVYPLLGLGQKAVLVPGACGTTKCGPQCYDSRDAIDAEDFANWAISDPLVIGVFPFYWNINGTGTVTQPTTRAAWQRLMPLIAGGAEENFYLV